MTEHDMAIEHFTDRRSSIGRDECVTRKSLDPDLVDRRIAQAGNIGADIADDPVEPGQDDIGTLPVGGLESSRLRECQARQRNRQDARWEDPPCFHGVSNPE